jgi:hypothetical protein
VDDLELDRELLAALDVTPSPEFVARVRVAVADQRKGPLPGGWLVPAGFGCATIAAIVLAGTSWNVSDQPERRADTLPVRPSVEQKEVQNQQPTERHREPQARPVVHAPRVAPAGDTRDIPEVLISQADKRAFEEFVSTVQQRQFAATFEDVPESTPWLVTELSLAPITIEPLDTGTSNTVTAHN